MSKFRESDMQSQPEGKKRPEFALLEVAWNVLSTNLDEWRTSRAAAVDISRTALAMRQPDLATIQAYDN